MAQAYHLDMGEVARLTDVTVRRGKFIALNGVDLSIASGHLIGLLGPSGAGKSTLMRVLLGIQSGVSGQVQVLGEPAGSRNLDRRVAYSTQSSSVFDDLSVLANLKFAGRILGVGSAVIERVLVELDLTAVRKQKVGALSGGQRNRVSLAIAMLGDPEVLVLDEPTVGLDPVLRGEIWAIFRRLADAGKTLVISSHVMDEAERCDHIVFVRDGRVIADDSLAGVLAATKTNSAEDAFLALAKRGEAA